MTEHRPLHILLVHVWYYPHVGGGNQHVEQIGMELVRRGHKVTVWCADVPEHEESRFNRGGIDVIRIKPSRVLAGVDPVVSINDLSLDGVDLIHLHDTLPILIRKTLKRARKEKIPVVTTYHNDYIKTSILGKIMKKIRWAMQGRDTLHKSDAIIVLTSYFENLLRIKGVKGNLDIIPNGFSKIEDLPSIPDSLAERNSKRPLLVFVGRLSYQKGLDILMDAVDKFETDPGFDLAIAGKGELSEWLKERHAKLGRSKIVKILGLVTDSEKLWLYENATAVVIPSRFEGLPTVLLEAMYSSCPVIMSDVNGLGSLVSESNSGLSTLPENPEILSRMMHEIANSEIEQLSIWGNNGFETSKKYLWSSVTENILQVYKRVLE